MKRIMILVLTFATMFGILRGMTAYGARSQEEKVVRVTAKRFEYTPKEISVKRGTTLILELTSEDRVHGFNLPDFDVRTEVKPGEVSRIKITVEKTGRFDFACDVFCGSGHEDMSGTLIVTD